MKTIVLIGSYSHLRTGLLTGLLSSGTNGVVAIDYHLKNVPQKIDFDLDAEPVIIPDHSFKSVQKRNVFFNKRIK